MDDFGSFLNFIDESLQSQTAYLNQQNLIQQEMELSEEERSWSEKMLDKQNAWNLTMWNAANEYNNPTHQVQRLRDAGLNPLYYGLDGSSANGVQSAQPLGYERASVKGIANPALGIETKMALRSLEKDIQLKNAQIDSIKENTKGTSLDNEWKDKTMDARAEAVELANSLSKKEVDQIDQALKESEQRIKESIQRVDNLVEEKALIQSQKMLNTAMTHEAEERAKEIATLLPFRKLLIEAQTSAEKAHAAYLWTQQAKEQKLLDDGFYDSMVKTAEKELERAGIDVEDAKVQQAIHKWQLSIKTGTAFDIEGEKGLGRVFSILGNVGTSFVSTCAEAMGGSIAPLIGAGIIGKGASKAGSRVINGATPDVVGKQIAAMQ